MNNFKDIIESINKICSYRSVKETPQENMPFGRGVSDCLNYSLSLAESLGFSVKNYDGYCGEINFGDGLDQDGLSILCHIDVVPSGDEKLWNFPPYSATICDNKLYGRGVVDDKGPFIICLYALKELKDSGFIPSKKIKLIIGGDEESGWGCMEHYNKVATLSKDGFSPDGDFPVIYAEKGILHARFYFDKNEDIESVMGGERVNMVPDYAYAKLKNKQEKVEFFGKSAHGSTPENGDNAIEKLLNCLQENGYFSSQNYDKLFKNSTKIKNVQDDICNLTFSPNMISIIDDKICVDVDIRYPVKLNKKDIEKELSKISKFSVLHHQSPLFVDKNSKLVSTLNSIYCEYKNVKEEPILIGGGTYARTLKNGVAFGPLSKDDSRAHIPNEYLTLDEIKLCYDIYKKAIYELSK